MKKLNKKDLKQVSCKLKNKYSESTAREIEKNGFKNNPDLKVYRYKCNFCKSYHITKKHPLKYKIDSLKRSFESILNRVVSILLISCIIFIVVANLDLI